MESACVCVIVGGTDIKSASASLVATPSHWEEFCNNNQLTLRKHQRFVGQ